MRYAAMFLRSAGQECKILRTPPRKSRISMKRSTRAIRDFGAREAHWEGLILRESALVSGDVFELDGIKYLVQSVNIDHSTGELSWYAARVNATLLHQRFSKEVDDKFKVSGGWADIASELHSFGEIVTAELRKQDLGLLETTRYLFQVTQKEGDQEVKMMDRVVFNGRPYQVDAVNDIGMTGVVRLQASHDVRV